MDEAFKAPADDSPRTLLDRLSERNGRTLTELCGQFGHGAALTRRHVLGIAPNLQSTNSLITCGLVSHHPR
jgi:hypothetical protein